MTSRVVKNEYERGLLIRFIEAQHLPFTANISKGGKRSVEQNRLQWLLINEIAEQLGDRTAEEVRGECKLMLGVPILRAENEEFRERYDEVVRPLLYAQKLAIMMTPLDLPITRLMTVAQQTRYLDAIYRRYSELGCVLTVPSAEAA